MSNSVPIMVLGSLLAGGAGAVGATILLSPNPGPIAKSAVPNVTLQDTVAKLSDRIETLADRLDGLERSDDLAPVASPGRVAATLDRAEIEGVVRDMLGSVEGAPAAATPSLEAAVANVIEMREERERQERDQRRAEAEEKRLEDRLAKLQSDLGLDQTQLDSMRGIFQEQSRKADEMRQSMREARDTGLDMGSMREMWTDLRDSTNESIKGVLSPSQYEQYEESNANQRWGGRGGNTGGRGGRGGR